jgi:hydroxyethylthiazole kinase
MSHAAATAKALQAIGARKPLIHNVTNLVAVEVVANCLLALGASPAMVIAEEEVEDFVGLADALVVNTGTLTATSARAMHKAAARAGALGKPWVLDPVGVGGTPHRTRVATQLAAARPTVIRANASEILALAGAATAPTRGVDSTHAAEDALDAARELARRHATVVAVTGAVDHITDGERWLRVDNGEPMMTRVSALGCAASAVIGTFLAVEADPLMSAAAALSAFGLAGERAAAQSAGPGSLRWQIVDQLALLDEATVREGVRIA